jgi:prepilin-type N-terminal cleavage/methylation domain-containing protein
VKRKRTGLTLIELLVVLGIIALLVGILIPALTIVQQTARETKQKAQISHIDLALTAFKNDYGDYPPSDLSTETSGYCGAQKMTEALLGWDLLGFNPDSDFNYNGYNDNNVYIYDPEDADLFDQRKGPYLDTQAANAFRLGYISNDKPGLYNNTLTLAADTYVICDVFGKRKIKLDNGKTVSAGAPILYYRADTSTNTIQERYDPLDNDALVQVKELADDRGDGTHPLGVSNNNYENFYEFIQDPKISAKEWPYRPDSYILISAGADGLYGTSDDVCNFGN